MKNSFERPGKIIKNTMIAALATMATLGSIDAKAGNGGGNNKPGIETLKQEHIMRGVEAKDLKKMLNGYTTTSELVFDMLLEKGGSFLVSEGVGNTPIAAKSSAEQKLSNEGKVSRVTFTKDLGNGNISVILIALEK